MKHTATNGLLTSPYYLKGCSGDDYFCNFSQTHGFAFSCAKDIKNGSPMPMSAKGVDNKQIKNIKNEKV